MGSPLAVVFTVVIVPTAAAPVADIEGATRVSLNKIFPLHLLRGSSTSFTGFV
jgi:hypothetical protein